MDDILNDPSGPRTLEWSQPGALTREYELTASGQAVGSLVFRSASGSLATAQIGGRCWTFKRVGFFQTRVSIRECGAHPDVAVFTPDSWAGGGTLETSVGKRILVDTSFWKSVVRFARDSGETLVTLTTSGVFHLKGTIQVTPGASEMQELPLLLALGWYLVVMMHSDMAASAVIIG